MTITHHEDWVQIAELDDQDQIRGTHKRKGTGLDSESPASLSSPKFWLRTGAPPRQARRGRREAKALLLGEKRKGRGVKVYLPASRNHVSCPTFSGKSNRHMLLPADLLK